MPLRKKKTWLLVGDAAKAQLYAVSAIPLRIKKVDLGAFRSSPKTTHGPEHQPETLHTAGTAKGHGTHRRHEDVFIEHVAVAVDASASENEFDELIVVLPPKALAHFRKVVCPTAQKKIKHEIAGEWTNLTIPDIEKHLSACLP